MVSSSKKHTQYEAKMNIQDVKKQNFGRHMDVLMHTVLGGQRCVLNWIQMVV